MGRGKRGQSSPSFPGDHNLLFKFIYNFMLNYSEVTSYKHIISPTHFRLSRDCIMLWLRIFTAEKLISITDEKRPIMNL